MSNSDNPDGGKKLADWVFELSPEEKAVYKNWWVPFVIKIPNPVRKVIRKIVKYGDNEYASYSPAPDNYLPQEGETIVPIKNPLWDNDSEPTISEASIPYRINPNGNFPTKY